MVSPRNSLPAIMLVAALVAFPIAGYVLYQWLDDTSDAEVLRLRRGLDYASRQIQSDIALEFAVMTSIFLYTKQKLSEDMLLVDSMKLFPALYKKWLYGTRFPDLIEDFYLVDRTGEVPRVYRYAVSEEQFYPTEGSYPESLEKYAVPTENVEPYGIVSYPEELILVIPLKQYAEKLSGTDAGYLLVLLDSSYFAKGMVSELFNFYLGSPEKVYSFAIADDDHNELLCSSSGLTYQDLRETVNRGVDQIIPLTARLSPNDPTIKDTLRQSYGEFDTISEWALSLRIEDPLVQQWFDLRPKPGSELAASNKVSDCEEPQRISRSIDVFKGINLYVWHSSGSIERAAAAVRNRRLAVGYIVLCGFAAAAVVFYLLYRRAKYLRDREHEFVATVTHELRTPVSAMHAVADNLAEGIVRDPVQVREYGKALLDHGRRLRNLIDQVLLYAGLSGTRRRSQLSPIKLDEVVDHVASHMPDLPMNRLIIHIQPNLPLYSGDRVAVETIISNLLSNSGKHNDKGTTVTLHVYSETNRARLYLVIRVSDTGRGIPRRELGRIREPFYRGVSSQLNQVPGNGLGLSLVNRIVQTYGGSLTMDSVVDRGTTATVRLPYEQRDKDET